MLLSALLVFSIAVAVAWCLAVGGFVGLAWIWMLPVGTLAAFLGLGLITFFLVWLLSAIIDTGKEQKEDSPFYRWLIKVLVEAAHTILGMRVHAVGLEKTPKEGRFLLACNHLFDFDPVVLLHHFPKSQLAFISKRENGSMFVVGKLMHRILCQPINRENDREALKTILNCVRIIKEDKASIAVFPEGYTSRDHLLHHFRSGVFKIAQKAQVPIVVCTITNTHKVLGNLKRLKPTDIDLHLLEVIQPEAYAGVTTVELAARIHKLMAEDLGPDAVAEK